MKITIPLHEQHKNSCTTMQQESIQNVQSLYNKGYQPKLNVQNNPVNKGIHYFKMSLKPRPTTFYKGDNVSRNTTTYHINKMLDLASTALWKPQRLTERSKKQ